jgi:hypothetical protein
VKRPPEETLDGESRELLEEETPEVAEEGDPGHAEAAGELPRHQVVCLRRAIAEDRVDPGAARDLQSGGDGGTHPGDELVGIRT